VSLAAGTKLGPYEVVAPLGAGGMGEVYRARDTRLNRTVAIKVLPAKMVSDVDSRQRFEREAKTISALQHPNICTLYDLGHQDGVDYLVLEFVEGETLEARLAKGPLPVEQVLRYSGEIAGALDKAHRQGIVHRDLKPGNIMLTKSGAKLLDFGLAKLQVDSAALSSALTEVTVADAKLTAAGMLVGTFQYMAPEQLEGKEADGRSDIFALGAVIYEMATGKAAFAGKSRASLIAAILSTEPPAISSVQPMTPPALDRVVKRCLAKDPDDRWQNAGDLASELKWIGEGGSQAGVAAPVTAAAPAKKPSWLPWAVAAAFAALAFFAMVLYLRNSGAPANSIQAYLPPPDNTTYFFSGDGAGYPIISPQGDQVAFAASDEKGTRLLWVRSLADGSARSLPGTDSATLPFWSPDGKSLAYFASGKVKRVAVVGGAPVDIVDAENPRGGSWGANDIIIYTPSTQNSIFSVPTTGGTPKQVTAIDHARHTTHRWPYFLPDGKHFLYLAASHAKPHSDLDEIYVASLDGKENRRLTGATSNAVAVPGYLLFLQGTSLMAQPFDLSSATLKGEPVSIAPNVHFEEGNWRGVFDCAQDGTLVYQSAMGSQGTQLVWYGRDGRVLGKLDEVGRYGELRLSPDGHKLVAAIGDPASSIWVYDLVRGVRTRYTFAATADRSPIWSADGRQILFMRNSASGGSDIYAIDTDSAGTEKLFYSSKTLKRPTDSSPDGKTLAITETQVGVGVSLLPTTGDKQPSEFLSQKLNTSDAMFSPDGHWVAYSSQESGRNEIFVTQFPEARGKWQISASGGRQPRWRRDGKAIFFWATDQNFMEAEVETKGGQFQVGAVRPLFKVAMPLSPFGSPTYDVTPDGQRFIVNTANSTGDQPLTVVTNWTARVKK
jgi:Tol biopolymer transport system component/tRNA A-37 threonylcarbamoyl transferase component Bud32